MNKIDITQAALADELTDSRRRRGEKPLELNRGDLMRALDAQLATDYNVPASPTEAPDNQGASGEDAEFEEGKHPRGEGGKFTAGQGAKPSNHEEHRSQAAYHKETAAKNAGNVKLRKAHERAATAHGIAAANHKMFGSNDPDSQTMSSSAHKDSERAEAAGGAQKPAAGGQGSSSPAYNPEAVQQAINKDPRIKGKEAKAIHALLKGRTGGGAPAQKPAAGGSQEPFDIVKYLSSGYGAAGAAERANHNKLGEVGAQKVEHKGHTITANSPHPGGSPEFHHRIEGTGLRFKTAEAAKKHIDEKNLQPKHGSEGTGGSVSRNVK